MRKQPTEEQKRKAAERRERFKALAKQVAELGEDERLALAARAGIRTIEGRELSVVNQCLLLTQHKNPSVVGGFQQWRRASRQVRKGEHGLSIWIPVGFGRKDGEATGAEIGESGEEKRRGFIMGTVFDISQTDPADGPARVSEELTDAEYRMEQLGIAVDR